MGFELAEQLGWNVPDVIVYPTGGGVGLIGIDKALRELQAIGLLDGRMPRMVAVQSSGCAPIVRAFDAGARESQFWENARTVAFGITVPKALGDMLVLDSLYATGGTAIAVSDAALLAKQREISRDERRVRLSRRRRDARGRSRCASGGWIRPGERVLLINTGSGMKYPDVPYEQPALLDPRDDL